MTVDIPTARWQRTCWAALAPTTRPARNRVRVPALRRIAIDYLGLEEAVVVHAGRESYRLGERVRAVAARRLGVDLGLDDYSRR